MSSDDDDAAAAAEVESIDVWHRFCFPPGGDYYSAPRSPASLQSSPSSSSYRPPSPLSTAAFQQTTALIKLKINNFCSRKVQTFPVAFPLPLLQHLFIALSLSLCAIIRRRMFFSIPFVPLKTQSDFVFAEVQGLRCDKLTLSYVAATRRSGCKWRRCIVFISCIESCSSFEDKTSSRMVLCQFLQRSTLPLPLLPSPPLSPYSIHRIMNASNSRPFCFLHSYSSNLPPFASA